MTLQSQLNRTSIKLKMQLNLQRRAIPHFRQLRLQPKPLFNFLTGLFKDECKAWNHLVTPSRTWATFKLIFTAAARELMEMHVLTGNTGYVNNVAHELMDQNALALNTLATVTSEDR